MVVIPLYCVLPRHSLTYDVYDRYVRPLRTTVAYDRYVRPLRTTVAYDRCVRPLRTTIAVAGVTHLVSSSGGNAGLATAFVN